jgi:hypothetical protein
VPRRRPGSDSDRDGHESRLRAGPGPATVTVTVAQSLPETVLAAASVAGTQIDTGAAGRWQPECSEGLEGGARRQPQGPPRQRARAGSGLTHYGGTGGRFHLHLADAAGRPVPGPTGRGVGRSGGDARPGRDTEAPVRPHVHEARAAPRIQRRAGTAARREAPSPAPPRACTPAATDATAACGVARARWQAGC